jgi:hypothetical protein
MEAASFRKTKLGHELTVLQGVPNEQIRCENELKNIFQNHRKNIMYQFL